MTHPGIIEQGTEAAKLFGATLLAGGTLYVGGKMLYATAQGAWSGIKWGAHGVKVTWLEVKNGAPAPFLDIWSAVKKTPAIPSYIWRGVKALRHPIDNTRLGFSMLGETIGSSYTVLFFQHVVNNYTPGLKALLNASLAGGITTAIILPIFGSLNSHAKEKKTYGEKSIRHTLIKAIVVAGGTLALTPWLSRKLSTRHMTRLETVPYGLLNGLLFYCNKTGILPNFIDMIFGNFIGYIILISNKVKEQKI